MKSNPQNIGAHEETMIALDESEISTEELTSGRRSVVSADQMEDVSFQANGQNFQHN